MAILVGVAEDYGYTITFNIKHLNGLPADLTGCTVTLGARIDNPSYVPIERTCTISITPTLGVCAYTIQQGDFIQPGQYDVELTITNTGLSKVTTVQGMIFNVRPRKT